MVHLSSTDWVQQVWEGGPCRRKGEDSFVVTAELQSSAEVIKLRESRYFRFKARSHLQSAENPNPRPPNTGFPSDFTLEVSYSLMYALISIPPFSCNVKYTCSCSEKRMNALRRPASKIHLMQHFLCRSYTEVSWMTPSTFLQHYNQAFYTVGVSFKTEP